MSKKITNGTLLSFQKMSVKEGTNAFGELRQAVISKGILERSYVFYLAMTLLALFGFSISLFFIIVSTSLPLLFLLSMVFAFFSVQLGGLMHDAGHRAIFKSTKFNDIFGYFCGALIIKRYTNWRVNHNRHHAHPNQDEGDPDIEIPFSFSEDRYNNKKGIIGLIRRYQAYFYFPFGSLVAFRMRVNDVISFKKNPSTSIIWEMFSLSIGIFLTLILPFFIFNLDKALLIIIVYHLSAGLYLLNVFAPNHKGMPELEKDVKISFVEQQIITSRNIHGHWLTDFIYMGLNYQIEHHLFPNTPRNKLKLITPYVKKFCREENLPYTSVSVIQTNQIILSQLNEVATISH